MSAPHGPDTKSNINTNPQRRQMKLPLGLKFVFDFQTIQLQHQPKRRRTRVSAPHEVEENEKPLPDQPVFYVAEKIFLGCHGASSSAAAGLFRFSKVISCRVIWTASFGLNPRVTSFLARAVKLSESGMMVG